MDLLLDTHTCLWWATEPATLAAAAQAAIADPANAVWASAASAWELAIKVRAGKLTVDVDRLFAEMSQQGIGLLGIGIDDAIAAGSLDWSHRDPFDRMLAAQARRAGHTLITRDSALIEFLGERSLRA